AQRRARRARARVVEDGARRHRPVLLAARVPRSAHEGPRRRRDVQRRALAEGVQAARRRRRRGAHPSRSRAAARVARRPARSVSGLMAVRIVRLGSDRLPKEGLRIGTVRRPPRGVPKSEFAAEKIYYVWVATLAPCAET